MAKKETPQTLERTYNVPLRKEYLKAPNWKRTPKAVIALRQFLTRHMKSSSENIKLGISINKYMWKHGMKNPPHHVKITVAKDEKGVVRAELFGVKIETPAKKEEKKKSKSETPKA